MVANPLQFAVVREDPLIEMELLKYAKAGEALLVASGGCVALSLKAYFPDLKLTLFDFNKAQLEHVQKKIEKLRVLEANRSNAPLISEHPILPG